jgi:hypothetical protein
MWESGCITLQEAQLQIGIFSGFVTKKNIPSILRSRVGTKWHQIAAVAKRFEKKVSCVSSDDRVNGVNTVFV